MVKYEKDLNNKSRNKVAQKHDYQINFGLIDGVSSNTQNTKRKTTTAKPQNIYAAMKKSKPIETKKVEVAKKSEPFVPAQMPNPQMPEVVNYPVYFFNPVEIDGKLWVPQPVFPEMLNWDKEKGEFKFPSTPFPAQAPQPTVSQMQQTHKVEPVVQDTKEPTIDVKSNPFAEDIITKPKIEKVDPLQAFSDEVEQVPVAPKTSTENIKKNLRPISVRKIAPFAAGASVVAKPMKAGASVATKKKKHDVEFNARLNKFVVPWVHGKTDKAETKTKQAKSSKVQDFNVSESFEVFENSNVKAVKSDTLMRRLLRILLWILIVLFICFEAILLVSKPTPNGEISLLFGKGVVQQETNDMSPSINYGDLCFISKENTYSVNSVIAYVNDNDQFVLHRYLGVDSTGKARTKADSSKTLDNAFNKSNIIGKVDFVVPFAGYLVTFYVDKLILVLLVASLIACYVWKAKRRHT